MGNIGHIYPKPPSSCCYMSGHCPQFEAENQSSGSFGSILIYISYLSDFQPKYKDEILKIDFAIPKTFICTMYIRTTLFRKWGKIPPIFVEICVGILI